MDNNYIAFLFVEATFRFCANGQPLLVALPIAFAHLRFCSAIQSPSQHITLKLGYLKKKKLTNIRFWRGRKVGQLTVQRGRTLFDELVENLLAFTRSIYEMTRIRFGGH